MKVLHVIPSVSAKRGGPGAAIVPMIKALIDRGVEAEIATTNENGDGVLDVSLEGQTQYLGAPIRFFERSIPPIGPFKDFLPSLSFRRWLHANISQYSVIHVHSIFSFLPTTAMRLARRSNIPLVVRPLGMLDEWSLRQKALKKKTYLSLIEQKNLAGANAIQAMSPQEKLEIGHLFFPGKIAVIPHGITPSPLISNARKALCEKLSLPADEKIILYMSRFHPKKGLDLLISSLGNLKDTSFTLILAGTGAPEYEVEIRNMLERAGIMSRTLLPGFTSGADKDLFLQGADLFALTSYDENFGISVLEALAVGLPTVITKEVALSEFVARKDLGIIPTATADSVTDALRIAFDRIDELTSQENRSRVRRETLKEFQWETVAEQLEELYTGILNARTPDRAIPSLG